MKPIRRIAVSLSLCAALVLAASSCVQRQPNALTKTEAERMMARYAEARNTPDLGVLDTIYAGDVVVHDCSAPSDIVGLDALKAYYQGSHTAFPDFHIHFNGIDATHDTVVSRWTITGTNDGPLPGGLPATHQHVKFSGVALSRVAGGKIVEEWVDFNVLSLMHQLGFTLTPPASGEAQSN